MNSDRNEFPWIDVIAQRVSGCMFFDTNSNPMYFVLCIKCGEFKNQLIKFIEFCGGKVCSGFEDMNPYSAVLVDEKGNYQSYKGDVFKVSYIESCYNARRCLDISDYRHNSVSNIKPNFKYMDVVYFKKYTWSEIPAEFLKDTTSHNENNKIDKNSACSSKPVNIKDDVTKEKDEILPEKQLYLNGKKTTNHNQNNKINENSENISSASSCKPVNIKDDVTKQKDGKQIYEDSSFQNNEITSNFEDCMLLSSDSSCESVNINDDIRKRDLMKEKATQHAKQKYDDNSDENNKTTSNIEDCVSVSSDSSCESININDDVLRERYLMKEKATQHAKHSRLPYTHSEREAILKFIIKHDGISRIKGRAFWQKMEKEKVCHIRTWQSMKTHFLNKIILDLEIYKFLTTNQIREFKQFYVSKR